MEGKTGERGAPIDEEGREMLGGFSGAEKGGEMPEKRGKTC